MNERYEVINVKMPFGKGIEIYRQGYNKQIKSKKDLIARISPSEETSKEPGDSYMSVIYKYSVKDNKEIRLSITSNHTNKITALKFVKSLLNGKNFIQPEKEDKPLHRSLIDKESIWDEKEVMCTYHMEAEGDTEETRKKRSSICYLDSRSMVKPHKHLEKAKEAFNEGNFNEIIKNLKIMIKKGGPYMCMQIYDKVYSKMKESELEELAIEKDYSYEKIKNMKKRLREVKKDPEKYQGFRFWDYEDALELIFDYVSKKGNPQVIPNNQKEPFIPSANLINIKFEDLPFEDMKKYNESHNKEIYSFVYERRDKGLKVDPKFYGKPVHPFESTAKYFLKISKPIEALSCIKKSIDEKEGSTNFGYEDLLELSLDCIDSISSKK